MLPGSDPPSPDPFSSDPPDETFRLHPLTPIALGGRILGIVVAFVLLSLVEQSAHAGGGLNWEPFAIYAAIGAVVVGRGFVTVAVTSYHLVAGELRIDSGLLNKQSKRIRLNRVQSVDVLEPLAARVFGLAEVKVTTAGTERAAVRLRYLALPVAQTLRADLLGRSAGIGTGAAEAPERPLLVVPHGRLIGSVLLQMVSWRLVVLALGPALTVIGQQNGHGATTGIGIAIFVWFAILIGHDIWRRVTQLWGFTVTESPDGLRIRHGLLSTSRQTVPPGRIQALRIHQPLSWRPFGWVAVRMNVAGYAGQSSSKSTVLVPVSDRAFAESLVGWLLGGIDLATVPTSRPPRRAALRAPLWWRAESAGSDDRVFVARHGLLSRTIEVVPHERTQSVRLTAGPWSRALRLASMHLDSTRGPVKIRAPFRDESEARAMLDSQVARAQAARRQSGSVASSIAPPAPRPPSVPPAVTVPPVPVPPGSSI